MVRINLLTNLGISTVLLSTLGISVLTNSNSVEAQEINNNTTIEEVTEETNNLLGKQVTVRGQVGEVEPGTAFTINEEGFLEGDDVLVLNVSGETLPEMPEEELELQVTGTLGQLVLAEVEREYGLDLDPNLYVEYEDQLVIFANSMTLAPDIGEISENPEIFYDKEVAVRGEIEDIKSDNTFTLDEDQLIGGENLLVINTTGEAIPQSDDEILVTGTIRPFVRAEFERDYDLTWDLDLQQELEAEYNEKPVLVVESIYPAAEEEGLLE